MTPKIPSPCIGASEGAGRPGGTGLESSKANLCDSAPGHRGRHDLVSIDVREAYFQASGAGGRNDEDPTGSGHWGLAGGESSDQTRYAKCG